MNFMEIFSKDMKNLAMAFSNSFKHYQLCIATVFRKLNGPFDKADLANHLKNFFRRG